MGVRMAEVETGSARRRRRKSSRRKAATWPEYWRSAEFGRHLFIAMSLIGAAYAGTILWETRFYSYHYPPAEIGVTENQVRYMLGAPDSIEAGGRLYRYSEPGREVAVRLSPAGRLESISCAGGTPEPVTCPKVRGIGIGSNEYDVLLRLGAPSRESFRGDDKTMYYDGMGLAFQLRQFEVRRIELRRGGSFSGYFPRALLAMIP
jgi:hypothetical protein